MPTIRAIWLGQELRSLRMNAGLSARGAGTYLSRDATTVTRMELGEVHITDAMLQAFFEMCGLKDPHRRADLEFIHKDVAQAGWWDGYRGEIASTLMDRAWIEDRSTTIASFEPILAPGLLQTREYAEIVIRALDADAPDEQIERWVDVRMNRQAVVMGHRPLRFDGIIDHSALTRRIGGAEVMARQLDHLVMALERPNIQLRVLPVDVAAHAGLSGAFAVYTMVRPYPVVGFADTSAGELCVEGEAVDRLVRSYDRLLEACLDVQASRELIIAERNKL
ncbi:helix-turn-helix domain-containing protein [Actinorhabdospora filicis]|uniref:helix-turn-helix domain-containing protein n=1 Tax=Actinorhabdospora filicis TaxID=1785913 RepID=UPI0025530AAD|nr:helix-turn-helix transcriptional regulator [Actinorhabdospora filicis]